MFRRKRSEPERGSFKELRRGNRLLRAAAVDTAEKERQRQLHIAEQHQIAKSRPGHTGPMLDPISEAQRASGQNKHLAELRLRDKRQAARASVQRLTNGRFGVPEQDGWTSFEFQDEAEQFAIRAIKQ